MEEMVPVPSSLAVEPAVDADAAAKHDQQEARRWHLALHEVLDRMNTPWRWFAAGTYVPHAIVSV